jgi:hypothetical protein
MTDCLQIFALLSAIYPITILPDHEYAIAALSISAMTKQVPGSKAKVKLVGLFYL